MSAEVRKKNPKKTVHFSALQAERLTALIFHRTTITGPHFERCAQCIMLLHKSLQVQLWDMTFAHS